MTFSVVKDQLLTLVSIGSGKYILTSFQKIDSEKKDGLENPKFWNSF